MSKPRDGVGVEVKALTALAQDFAKDLGGGASEDSRRQRLGALLDCMRPIFSLLVNDLGPWLTFDPRALNLVLLGARLLAAEPRLRLALDDIMAVVLKTDAGVALSRLRREEFAFEHTLGRVARALAPRLSCDEIVEQAMGAELFVRSLCLSLDAPLRVGKRAETRQQSEEVLRRIDAGQDPTAEARLAYERRQAQALAHLQQAINAGGALPNPDRFRSR